MPRFRPPCRRSPWESYRPTASRSRSHRSGGFRPRCRSSIATPRHTFRRAMARKNQSRFLRLNRSRWDPRPRAPFSCPSRKSARPGKAAASAVGLSGRSRSRFDSSRRNNRASRNGSAPRLASRSPFAPGADPTRPACNRFVPSPISRRPGPSHVPGSDSRPRPSPPSRNRTSGVSGPSVGLEAWGCPTPEIAGRGRALRRLERRGDGSSLHPPDQGAAECSWAPTRRHPTAWSDITTVANRSRRAILPQGRRIGFIQHLALVRPGPTALGPNSLRHLGL